MKITEVLTEEEIRVFRDFTISLSPHHRDQAKTKQVNLNTVDVILNNLSQIKDKIMSLEPGRAMIVHDGQGTGLGIRRRPGRLLHLATVFPTSAGYRKGKHPTFRVDTDPDTKN